MSAACILCRLIAGELPVLADGEAALQEVPHVHLHVFPRFAGDRFRLDSGQREAQRGELEHAATAIRKAWSA